MSKHFLIGFIALLFGPFSLADGQLENIQIQEEIDVFFEEIISGERGNEILGDFSALKEQLPYSEGKLLEQLLDSVFRSQSEVEFALKKQAWVTVAREQPSGAAISSSMMLSEEGEEIRVKTLIGIMLDSDYPPSPEEDWNLDKYWPIFKATQENPFYRLVIYAYEAAPSKALEMMLELYGENIAAEDRQNIIKKAEEIAQNLRQHDQLFDEGESVDGIVDFFVGLTKFDEWFLDLFIAVCLKKDRLQNVSSELNQYFSSKPESLAEKLRMGLSVSSLPKQQLPLEKIMEVNQHAPKAVYDQQATSQKTQGVKVPTNESKSSTEKPHSLSWLYWMLGTLILGGVGVLVWNSRKGVSAR